MSGMDYVENEDFQRELIWMLSHSVGLTQEEIAAHPLVRKSQPSISRTLDEYSPVTDGFEHGAKGYGDMEDLDEDFLADRREAAAAAMETSPVMMTALAMVEMGTSED